MRLTKKQIERLPVQPTNDNVLVKMDVPPGKTKGGIVLPNNMKERGDLKTGLVLAVGPGGFHYKGGGRVEMTVVPGQSVLIEQDAGELIPDGFGKGMVLVQMHEIKAVVY